MKTVPSAVHAANVSLIRHDISAGPVVATLAIITLLALVTLLALAYFMHLRDRR